MAKKEANPRFYGGHYDSVKQGSVRSALEQEVPDWKQVLKNKYAARLRLDILLSGNVIITDAQYYDGTFFQLAQSDSSFYRFLNTLNEADPVIEVRRRPQGVINIFEKPFTFSSLPSDEVKREIVRIMKAVMDKRKRPFKSLEEAQEEYGAAVDSQDARIAFEEVVQNIISMDAKTPEWIFRDWDLSRPFGEYVKLAKETIPFTFPVTGILEVDESIREISNEMANEYPNRTKVIEILNDMRSQSQVTESKGISNQIGQIWAHVLKIYNRAFAYQHGCNIIDIGEDLVAGISEEDREQIQELMDIQSSLLDDLSSNITEAIVEESWEEFYTRINKAPILPVWTDWRRAKIEALTMPKGLKRTTFLLKRLGPLVSTLREEYGQTQEWAKVVKTAITTVSSTAALVAGETILAGGSYPDVFVAAGLLISSLPILFGAYEVFEKGVGKTPGDVLNLVRLGLK